MRRVVVHRGERDAEADRNGLPVADGELRVTLPGHVIAADELAQLKLGLVGRCRVHGASENVV
jgi:hypothetical protein